MNNMLGHFLYVWAILFALSKYQVYILFQVYKPNLWGSDF